MVALMPRELTTGHRESKSLIFPSSWLLLCTVIPVKRQGNTDMYLHDLLSIMIHSDLIGKEMSLQYMRSFHTYKIYKFIKKKKKKQALSLPCSLSLLYLASYTVSVLIHQQCRLGTFLVGQYLRLCAPNAEGPDLIPGQGSR